MIQTGRTDSTLRNLLNTHHNKVMRYAPFVIFHSTTAGALDCSDLEVYDFPVLWKSNYPLSRPHLKKNFPHRVKWTRGGRSWERTIVVRCKQLIPAKVTAKRCSYSSRAACVRANCAKNGVLCTWYNVPPCAPILVVHIRNNVMDSTIAAGSEDAPSSMVHMDIYPNRVELCVRGNFAACFFL